MFQLLNSVGLNLQPCFLNKTEDATEDEPTAPKTSEMLSRCGSQRIQLLSHRTANFLTLGLVFMPQTWGNLYGLWRRVSLGQDYLGDI